MECMYLDTTLHAMLMVFNTRYGLMLSLDNKLYRSAARAQGIKTAIRRCQVHTSRALAVGLPPIGGDHRLQPCPHPGWLYARIDIPPPPLPPSPTSSLCIRLRSQHDRSHLETGSRPTTPNRAGPEEASSRLIVISTGSAAPAFSTCAQVHIAVT